LLVRFPLMPFMVPRSKLVNHVAAVSLYVAHYNLWRAREALKTTQAVALDIAQRHGRSAIFVDAVLAIEPPAPIGTAPDREPDRPNSAPNIQIKDATYMQPDLWSSAPTSFNLLI
jgi:hypothetical protein